MVIDKTTGKGCAWSIASKTITKKLVADGIVDKTIFRKARPNGCELIQVVDYGGDIYVKSQWKKGRSEEPLWVPTFIDKKLWEQMVGKFQIYRPLDRSVEKYLLPEMEDYLQNISSSELVSITREFLIANDVINTPIRQHKGKTYYFNEDEIYSLDKNSQLFPYEKRVKFDIFQIRCETCFNMTVWRKAASRFEVGMTLEECIEIFLETELTHQVPQEPTPIDRLAQYITPPVYERVPGNNNETTFDRIRIMVGLPRYQFNSWEALQNEVKKYKHEIYQRVVRKLEEDRQFKRYGVPINFLKLSNVTLLRDFSLEFIFELKEKK